MKGKSPAEAVVPPTIPDAGGSSVSSVSWRTSRPKGLVWYRGLVTAAAMERTGADRASARVRKGVIVAVWKTAAAAAGTGS